MKKGILVFVLTLVFLSYSILAQETCLNGNGIVCDGFCYTSTLNIDCIDGKFSESQQELCRTTSDCQQGYVCSNDNRCDFTTSTNYDVRLNLSYPKSVPVDTDFQVELILTSVVQFPRSVTIMQATFDDYPHAFSGYQQVLNLNNIISLNPFEEKRITFTMRSGPDPTLTGAITIITSNQGVSTNYGIVAYDQNQPVSVCGQRTYNTATANCINNVLYPLGSSTTPACTTDSDCGVGTCFSNVCVYRSNLIENPSSHSIPVVPLFLSNTFTSSEISDITARINANLSQASQWFNNEKDAWGNQDPNFSFDWLIQQCPGFNKADLLRIASASSDVLTFFSSITTECNVNGYPIVYYFLTKGFDNEIQNVFNSYNLPASAGLNLGNYVMMGSNQAPYVSDIFFPTLVHESYHSFAMFDIYYYGLEPGGFYQWRDCNLFKANWNIFSENPQLCSLEAYMLGFILDPLANRGLYCSSAEECIDGMCTSFLTDLRNSLNDQSTNRIVKIVNIARFLRDYFTTAGSYTGNACV